MVIHEPSGRRLVVSILQRVVRGKSGRFYGLYISPATGNKAIIEFSHNEVQKFGDALISTTSVEDTKMWEAFKDEG